MRNQDMVGKSSGRWGLFGFFLASAIVGMRPAAADTLWYDGPAYRPYFGTNRINVAFHEPSVTRTVSPGGFQMANMSSASAGSFVAWCVDVYGTLQSSNSYTQRTGEQFYGVSSRTVTDLERLASYSYAKWSAPASLASPAYQLAVWEIAIDTASGNGLSADNFAAASGDSAIMDLAGSWINVVNAGTYTITQDLGIGQKGARSTRQNLAVLAPIPEAETYTMLIAGLGLMVFVARRRRSIAA